ncbi:YbaB/EbfC family nucleoid-associated protein [Nocardia macrotermitis]|uniref:Nucleoid-associated protein YbaB n=1 Tax=Nocardia macrotermitis TaxID=2585198 RepID=A0A7K0DE46_9NOCA|nr:YbaB/EbfC family nucleoid-associated protein [Nocardia macrotermitis]MQY24076.1 Nucleoid-associated protein YbaB [Nocardia macrotermitis]
MVNERLAADTATMLEGLQAQMRGIAELQQRRSELTATASVGEDRVQVTVNADGMVVQTKFGHEAADLSYEELAEYVTAAAQAAMRGVQNRSRELMQPLIERRSRLPKLSEIIEGAPDLEDILPPAPPPSTEPPQPRDRVGNDDEQRPLIADTDH